MSRPLTTLNRADLDPEQLRQRAGRLHATVRSATDRWYRITNHAADNSADVYIYDEIGFWGVSAADFVRELVALNVATIALRINSPGGEVWDATAIYNALRNHPARIDVTVDGIAASAASFIAMAGDSITMGHGSQMMIHDALAICVGNAADMRSAAELLDKSSDNIAGFYAARAGGTVADWRERMAAETWYNAEEAVAAGLADKVVEAAPADAGVKNAWDLSVFRYAGRDQAPAPVTAHAVGTVPDPEADRGVAPAPTGLDAVEPPPVEPEPPAAELEPVLDLPAAQVDPAFDAEGFRAATGSAIDFAFDPDLFRAAVGVVATDAPVPEPYAPLAPEPEPVAGEPEPEPAPLDPALLAAFDPRTVRAAVSAVGRLEFDPGLFRAAIANVINDAPAAPDPAPAPAPGDTPPEIDPIAFRRALREARL